MLYGYPNQDAILSLEGLPILEVFTRPANLPILKNEFKEEYYAKKGRTYREMKLDSSGRLV